MARALALAEGDKVEEVEALRGGHAGGMVGHSALRGGHAGAHGRHSAHHFFSGKGNNEPDELDLSDRCWIDPDCDGRVWMTDFPPPPGFTGYQSCEWGDPEREYRRECSAEEIAILEADAAAAKAAERAEEEKLRDEWFALLRAEHSADAKQKLDAPAGEAQPAKARKATKGEKP